MQFEISFFFLPECPKIFNTQQICVYERKECQWFRDIITTLMRLACPNTVNNIDSVKPKISYFCGFYGTPFGFLLVISIRDVLSFVHRGSHDAFVDVSKKYHASSSSYYAL